MSEDDDAIRVLRWFMLLAGLMVFGVIMTMIHHKPMLSPAGAAPVTHHDDDIDKLHNFNHVVATHLTTSLDHDSRSVGEVYPVVPGKLWRSHDENGEMLRIEVQRSNDGAINGKTRYRSYTWTLTKVKEELR